MKKITIVLLVASISSVWAQESDRFRFGVAFSVGMHPSIIQADVGLSPGVVALDSEFYGSMETVHDEFPATIGGELHFGYQNVIISMGGRSIGLEREYVDGSDGSPVTETVGTRTGQFLISARYILNGSREGTYVGIEGVSTLIEWDEREEDSSYSANTYSNDLFGLVGFRFDFAGGRMFFDTEASFSPLSESFGLDFLIGVQTR